MSSGLELQKTHHEIKQIRKNKSKTVSKRKEQRNLQEIVNIRVSCDFTVHKEEVPANVESLFKVTTQIMLFLV